MSDTKVLLKSRKLERTSVPGIFKRGGSFVVVFRTGDGRQHKMAAPTISAAQRLKASLVMKGSAVRVRASALVAQIKT